MKLLTLVALSLLPPTPMRDFGPTHTDGSRPRMLTERDREALARAEAKRARKAALRVASAAR